jgi:hypothetical protein
MEAICTKGFILVCDHNNEWPSGARDRCGHREAERRTYAASARAGSAMSSANTSSAAPISI